MKLYAKREQSGFLLGRTFVGRIDVADEEELQIILKGLKLVLNEAKEQFEYYEDMIESCQIEVQNDVGYDEIEGYHSNRKLIDKIEEMLDALSQKKELPFE